MSSNFDDFSFDCYEENAGGESAGHSIAYLINFKADVMEIKKDLCKIEVDLTNSKFNIFKCRGCGKKITIPKSDYIQDVIMLKRNINKFKKKHLNCKVNEVNE